MWTVHTLRLALSASFGPEIELISPSVLSNRLQQICQPVSRENHPPISNPPCTNNISRRKHGSRCDHRAVRIATSRCPNPSTVAVGNLRRNLEALFSPRFKVSDRKFRELTPLKLAAVSERRCCRKTPLARDLRINRSCNPKAAKLFIDFVLSEAGQKIFVQKGRESARVGLKPEGYPSHLKLAPSRMALAEKLADYTRRYESLFVKRRGTLNDKKFRLGPQPGQPLDRFWKNR